jgi:hypothetical protein
LPDSTLRIRMEIVGEGVRRAELTGPARWAEFLADRTNAESS